MKKLIPFILLALSGCCSSNFTTVRYWHGDLKKIETATKNTQNGGMSIDDLLFFIQGRIDLMEGIMFNEKCPPK